MLINELQKEVNNEGRSHTEKVSVVDINVRKGGGNMTPNPVQNDNSKDCVSNETHSF